MTRILFIDAVEGKDEDEDDHADGEEVRSPARHRVEQVEALLRIVAVRMGQRRTGFMKIMRQDSCRRGWATAAKASTMGAGTTSS